MPNITQLDRLKSQLLTSGIQQQNQPLYQVINQLIDALRQAINLQAGQITDIINTPSPVTIGPIGPPGLDGFDGVDGEIGPSGIQGPIGPQGAAGQSNIPGFDGIDGLDSTEDYLLALQGFVNLNDGLFVDVPFAAGNFTGNGAQTWTLAAGDQLEFVYSLLGRSQKIMLVSGYFNTTTVGGVPNTDLQVVIPNGAISRKIIVGIARVNDNAAGYAAGTVYVTNGGTTINFQLINGANWAGSVNNTAVQFSLAFMI